MHIFGTFPLARGRQKPLKTSISMVYYLWWIHPMEWTCFFGWHWELKWQEVPNVSFQCMDRHEEPMRNGNLRCNDASFSIFRRADMSWRTFARYLGIFETTFGKKSSQWSQWKFTQIQIFSFLVPDVDLQSGKTGNVVGKCPGGALNHPH